MAARWQTIYTPGKLALSILVMRPRTCILNMSGRNFQQGTGNVEMPVHLEHESAGWIRDQRLGLKRCVGTHTPVEMKMRDRTL